MLLLAGWLASRKEQEDVVAIHGCSASVFPSVWEGNLVVDHLTSSPSSYSPHRYSFVLMLTWYYSCYLSECLSQT